MCSNPNTYGEGVYVDQGRETVAEGKPRTSWIMSSASLVYAQDHNQRCHEKLAPFLKDDKRALRWLRREAERGIGLVGPGPGGVTIDWN